MQAQDIDDAFGHWLAGFVDGEGCFFIWLHGTDNQACILSVALRSDDRPILEEIQRRLGIGGIHDSHKRGNINPTSQWVVAKQSEVAQLVRLFDRYPLRAKKARDFMIWREAVAVICNRTDPMRRSRLRALKNQMTAVRQFNSEFAVDEIALVESGQLCLEMR